MNTTIKEVSQQEVRALAVELCNDHFGFNPANYTLSELNNLINILKTLRSVNSNLMIGMK